VSECYIATYTKKREAKAHSPLPSKKCPKRAGLTISRVQHENQQKENKRYLVTSRQALVSFISLKDSGAYILWLEKELHLPACKPLALEAPLADAT
jgi:hypothetical protein